MRDSRFTLVAGIRDNRAVRPRVYAHRGGSALRPENTIEAFDNGLALGADGLEFDVRLTRDGAVAVHHDATLERTTNGRGPIAACAAGDLAGLDAGYWFKPTDAGHDFPYRGRGVCVPLLADVLARYPAVPLIIELKQHLPELAHRTIDAVRAAGALDRVALGSFSWRALRAARAYEPRVATGASREETRLALYRSWIGWPIRRAPFREFQVPETSGPTRIVSRRFIRHAHAAGLPVKVWTVDDAEDMRRLLDWGADAIITDRPDVAVDVVSRVSMR
jgi:glycerophosphoryl diester phosphodiesterase